MEYRKVFDTIPEQFDKFRPRYSAELFEYFIREASIGTETKVLERCGFIKEGTIRQGKMVSVYCDYNIYGMLREDYAKID